MDSQEVYERYQAGERNFEGVDMHSAYLNAFDLRAASLRRADLSDADLSGANLRQADLKAANLRGANLRYAHLDDANLRLVDLGGADLRGASLEGADLPGANLVGTIVDKNTGMSARWRQVWELVNRERQASDLEIETRVRPKGGPRARLLIDGEPFPPPGLGVALYTLALSLKEGGAYWLVVCPSCGTPGCSGIRRPVEIFWDGDRVHWVIFQPGPERALDFDGDAYREAVKKGLGRFVHCCQRHPISRMERMGNNNYYLVDVDLEELLGEA